MGNFSVTFLLLAQSHFSGNDPKQAHRMTERHHYVTRLVRVGLLRPKNAL